MCPPELQDSAAAATPRSFYAFLKESLAKNFKLGGLPSFSSEAQQSSKFKVLFAPFSFKKKE
jgi:hypothetical protein